MRKETFYEKYVKCGIDFCGACAALVVTAVPMAATAVAVRVQLGAPDEGTNIDLYDTRGVQRPELLKD